MPFDPSTARLTQPAAGGFDPSTAKLVQPAAPAVPKFVNPVDQIPGVPRNAPPARSVGSAGMSWYDKLRNAAGATGQSVEDLAKSVAVPFLNVASMIPRTGPINIGAQAQTDVRNLQRNVSPISQVAGGMIGGAPLAAGAGALAGPLMAAAPALSPLTAIGTGAALGAATSQTGQRGMGAILGGLGGAIPAGLTAAKYGVGKLFAPGVKDAADAAAVRAAQAQGFKVPPSELTGTPQVGREISGSFGPFAKKVPEQNIQNFGKQVFNTIGLKGETQINAANVSRAIQKVGGDFEAQIGSAKLTIDPTVANAIDSAISQNKPMLADMSVNPQSKGVAAAIYRAQQGQQISGQDYYKVSQWLRNKAATTSDGSTRDALENLERAWQNGASGDTARVMRALRVYRTRMAQALDLQSMMADPSVAAGTKPVNPGKLYSTMAKGKPSVLAGKSTYKLAPLSQSAAVTQAFGTGTKVPGWAERAASMEGLASLGNGEVRLPYTGKLNLLQKVLFGTTGMLSRDVLKQLATEEGQKMLLGGYKLSPEDLQNLARWSAAAGTTAGAATPTPTLPR